RILAYVTKGYFQVMSEHDFIPSLFSHKNTKSKSAAANKKSEIVLSARKVSNYLTLSVIFAIGNP
ncbi:MAG: hypothetical protein MJZ06_06760, partial [Bacteroidaceae bacterium]|nr:hypothetical protein [Bacteroidaceae bacterium]